MEYQKMLDRLYLSLPKQTLEKARFEIPEFESFIQGNRTIVKNFAAVLKIIRREEKHFLKFLTKELATPGSMEEGRLILNGKFLQPQLQSLLKSYVETYVLCHECKKPDTKIAEEQGVKMLKCEACGAFSPIRKL
jgi:translation initiation factor 2 subunit 2